MPTPERLAAMPSSFSGEHYWINLHGDLVNLSQLPRRAAAAWRPYLRAHGMGGVRARRSRAVAQVDAPARRLALQA